MIAGCQADHTIALLSLFLSTLCLLGVIFFIFLSQRKDRIIDVQDRLIIELQRDRNET